MNLKNAVKFINVTQVQCQVGIQPYHIEPDAVHMQHPEPNHVDHKTAVQCHIEHILQHHPLHVRQTYGGSAVSSWPPTRSH